MHVGTLFDLGLPSSGARPSLSQAASICGLGFLPIAEGNIAVPVALAMGIHPFFAVLLSVAGTTMQTLLVRALAGWLLAIPSVAGWWERRVSGRTGRLFAWKQAVWVVLIGIPWLGGVPTALGAQLAGIGMARYVRWAVSGLLLHAITLALLFCLGLHAVGRR